MIGLSEILAAKILIVDDQAVNIVLLERMLSGAGYRSVTSTTDPREVCELHRNARFDLILLDLQMPGFDGFEVMEELKGIETDAYLPVLVVTAQPGHKLRALRAGARDFVSKPFDLGEVLIRVHNLLELRLLHSQTMALYDQVVEAQKVSQQAIRARDDVLGIVAHDLRSPLNSIVMQLELIRRWAEDQGVVLAPLVPLHQAAHHMERMIRDLLDVAQLDAGQGLSIDQSCVDPQALIETAADAMQARARDAGLSVRVAGSESAPPIWGDQVRLLQVFDNLLGNAVKFTPSGGTVRVRVVPGEGEVVFSVADTGAGVSADHLPHLFDRFWQQDENDRRGAGLGLAIVKGIVAALGGRIWVESTPGSGTTFYFTVPVAPTEQRAARMRLEVARDRFTILLVEDDNHARMALHDVLQDEGYRVLAVASAASALDLLDDGDHTIHLLLTDVRIGAMDGVELAERVRAVRSIPVVFMTGLVVPPLLAGGVVIAKPIDIPGLLEVVEHELAASDAGIGDYLEPSQSPVTLQSPPSS